MPRTPLGEDESVESQSPSTTQADAPNGCPVPHDVIARLQSEAAPATSPTCPAGEFSKRDPAPQWSPEALAHVRQRAVEWRGDTERGEELARGVAEERARSRQQEITELFLRTLGKKLGYGHPLSEKGEELRFIWTAEAEARLAEVPEFCRELTRWRVEWTAAKLGLGNVITPREMEVKFELWGRVSHAIEARHGEGLPWTASARERFDRVPEFVRGQVLEAIEGNARVLGAGEVDDAVVDRVVERWIATGDFHEGRYGFR